MSENEQEIAYRLLQSGDYEKFLEFSESYLKSGEAWAQSLVGYCYLTGNGVEKDAIVAQHFFGLAADQGDVNAKFLLARSLLDSPNELNSREKALVLLNELSDIGHMQAACVLAMTILEGSKETPDRDVSVPLDLLQQAADACDIEAMHELASLYSTQSLQQDLSQSIKWYVTAADLGNPRSAYNAGLAFERGVGTDIDYAVARKYYAIATEADIAPAQHNFAALLASGRGGKVEAQLAFKIYKRAASQGSYLSAFNLSKMCLESSEVSHKQHGPAAELAWVLLAEEQARQLDRRDPVVVARIKTLWDSISDGDLDDVLEYLRGLGADFAQWVAPIIDNLSLHTGATAADPGDNLTATCLASKKPEEEPAWSVAMRVHEDLLSLPSTTQQFIDRAIALGFSQQQIHGLFVLLGLYVGIPRTESESKALIEAVDVVLPTNKNVNIDQVVGDFYPGYERELEEYCFRLGEELQFRDIKATEAAKPVHVLYPCDHGLLDSSVASVENLASSTRLFSSLLSALGSSTFDNQRSIKESFLCGVFQMQLLGVSDVSAAKQIGITFEAYRPLLLGRLFDALTRNQIEQFLKYEIGQVALVGLMRDGLEYAQQEWAYFSALFFHDGQRISGVEAVDLTGWHNWALDRAKAFGEAYPDQLAPFSASELELNNIPSWGDAISSFTVCDQVIAEGWGYSEKDLRDDIELREYKALVAHLIYASLTSSRERYC